MPATSQATLFTNGDSRVWDLPTRIFHWSLAALIAAAWWTAETGRMDWHRWAGSTILALIVFRIWWGVFGASTARFANFVLPPSAIVRYLRGPAPARRGHNPLGGLSVVGMLFAISAQVGLGLFAVDVDGLESGPLSDRVSFDAGRLAAEAHGAVFYVLMVLVCLHLAAIAVHALRGKNLVVAMFTGRSREASGTPGYRPARTIFLIAGILIAVAVGVVVSRGLRF